MAATTTTDSGSAKRRREASPAPEAASQLTVTLGSSSFTLTAAELANHPDDSLLAGLAAEGNSSLDLSSVAADNPLAAWPEVFAAIPSLYRGAGFPLDFLQQALQHHPQEEDNATTTTTTTTDEARYNALYDGLQRLLSFLGLPGPVTDWVCWESATLGQSRVLHFAYTCMVRPAVDAMMAYAPWRAWASSQLRGPPPGNAAFLLAPRHGFAPLDVYAVDISSTGISNDLSEMPKSADNRVIVFDRSYQGPPDKSTVPATDLLSPSQPRVALTKDQVRACIFAHDHGLGQQVWRALTAAAAPNTFEVQCVAADWRSHRYRGWSCCDVPLWVLRW